MTSQLNGLSVIMRPPDVNKSIPTGKEKIMAESRLTKAIEHVHTPDSWARAVLGAALKAQEEKKPLSGFSVTEHTDCIQICVDTPWGRICVCV
jgi:hypothetical protein